MWLVQHLHTDVTEELVAEKMIVLAETMDGVHIFNGTIFTYAPIGADANSLSGVFLCVWTLAVTNKVSLLPRVRVSPAPTLLSHGYLGGWATWLVAVVASVFGRTFVTVTMPVTVTVTTLVAVTTWFYATR